MSKEKHKEINVIEILFICQNDERWMKWWDKFYTDELKLRASMVGFFTVQEFSKVLNLTPDQIKTATVTPEDVRLVKALFKFSGERRKTEQLSNLTIGPPEGYIESDCLVCRYYQELRAIDPVTFSPAGLYELVLHVNKLADELHFARLIDRTESSVPHLEQEKQYKKIVRVLGILLFIISKTWIPNCRTCKEMLDHMAFKYHHYPLPCCFGFYDEHCSLGKRGKKLASIMEEVAVVLPVADIPEYIIEFL